jgi:ATP-dependent Clp protease protease subunit
MIQRNSRKKIKEKDSSVAVDKSSGTIYLSGEITQHSASVFRKHLRTLERLKSVSTILVEINSYGGDIEAGFMVIDSIELCKKSVTTRVTGVAMSMGALILAAGNIRESLPNSSIMIHQGSYRFSATFNEMHTEMAECERIEKLCCEFLDKRTKKEAGYWQLKYGSKSLYLTPKQALEEDLIDKILTKEGS